MAIVKLVKRRSQYVIEVDGKPVKKIGKYMLNNESESDTEFETRACKEFDDYVQNEKDNKQIFEGKIIKEDTI